MSGPLVWLDLDQQALDDAYDQSLWALNRENVLRRWDANSKRARAILGRPTRFAYGPTEIEALDLYRTEQPNAPINIFVHGGAWRGQMASSYSMLAETFVRAGAHLVVPDFTNVLETGGDLVPMVEQLRRAVAWVHANAPAIGGDPERIYLSAHSSGGHLGGCLLITPSLTDVIKGAVLISGMYDLEPVRRSKRSEYVTFTDRIVDALSPQRHLDSINCPLVIAYGTLETPEFQRQSRDFHAALVAAGKSAELIVCEDYNHFEILETLANPYGLAGRAALRQMGLG
jgi:arylformamidase